MTNERVGIVTEIEKDKVEKLFERNKSLDELLIALKDISISEEEKKVLYEKINKDKSQTQLELSGWWHEMSQKYRWLGRPDSVWTIDFDTREIFLRKLNVS